ncbi:MAG: AAA family ATPase, partial [Mucilaginibacter polytrichastri]|nr:AAA family ATPase [Mucilaginibacter polytrichastri]
MPVSPSFSRFFAHTPTEGQQQFFTQLPAFLAAGAPRNVMILRGYAGTGKTTALSALVKMLPGYGYRSVLLAPTGRAAKVLGNYTGRKALTIHKKIYRKRVAMSPDFSGKLGRNDHADTLFIVDEASMINAESGGAGYSSLLHDLVRYVYNGRNCRLLLVGDTAQLPPVGSADSLALQAGYLKMEFDLAVYQTELTEVLRQQQASGILYNATQIRDLIRTQFEGFPQLHTKGFKDIFRLGGDRLIEGLHYAYGKYGMENTLVICRSNKNANLYNQQIRGRILYREDELSGGDLIMIVRNNYYWATENGIEQTDFLANGDIARIKRIRGEQELYGRRFVEAQVQLIDYPEEPEISCKLMLDTLYTETPSLPQEESRLFYEEVMQDYADIPDKRKQMDELRANPYYNALQIKFSYAVTCHKAQGGQWDAIFVDQGYLTDEMLNTEFMRWLYTAITRSTKELFL